MIPAAPLITGAASGAASGLSLSGLMSAGGSLLSGVSGLFGRGSGQNNKAMWSQLNAMKEVEEDRAYNLPAIMAAGWKKAGIHPLAGMGINLGSGPSFSVGGGGSDSPAAMMDSMGQGITRAASAFSTREQKLMESVSAGLAIENQQLQNDRLRAEIQQMTAVGSPPARPNLDATGSAVGTTLSETLSNTPVNKLGLADGIQQLMRVAVDPHSGEPVRVLNQDVSDSEVLQALTAALYTVPDLIRGSFTKPAARKLRGYVKPYSRKPKFPRYKKGG